MNVENQFVIVGISPDSNGNRSPRGCAPYPKPWLNPCHLLFIFMSYYRFDIGFARATWIYRILSPQPQTQPQPQPWLIHEERVTYPPLPVGGVWVRGQVHFSFLTWFSCRKCCRNELISKIYSLIKANKLLALTRSSGLFGF